MDPSEELFQAATEGNVPRLRELIAAGCPVDARPHGEGPTPLVGALIGRRMEAVHQLVRAGADVGAARCEGKPLLIYAYTVVRDKGLFRTFLEAGARPNDVDEGDCPCLYHTLKANDYDSSSSLVSRGADVNATAGGETLLSHFVHDSKVVDFLLSKGADLKLRNPSNDMTALMALVGSGHEVDPEDAWRPWFGPERKSGRRRARGKGPWTPSILRNRLWPTPCGPARRRPGARAYWSLSMKEPVPASGR